MWLPFCVFAVTSILRCCSALDGRHVLRHVRGCLCVHCRHVLWKCGLWICMYVGDSQQGIGNSREQPIGSIDYIHNMNWKTNVEKNNLLERDRFLNIRFVAVTECWNEAESRPPTPASLTQTPVFVLVQWRNHETKMVKLWTVINLGHPEPATETYWSRETFTGLVFKSIVTNKNLGMNTGLIE